MPKRRVPQLHRHVEKTFALGLDMPNGKVALRLTRTGLDVVIRCPLELEISPKTDAGFPNIQPVVDGTTARMNNRSKII